MRQAESTESETQTGARENAQLEAVWQAMRDGAWRSVEEIAALVECPPASASARLRDLRKPQYGGWTVERAYVGSRLWRYRIRDKAGAGKAGMA
jgi:hypothetical protein